MGKRRDPTLEISHAVTLRMPYTMYLAVLRRARQNGRCVNAELREIIARDFAKSESA